MLNHRRISKLLSLMLRHRTEEFGLEMDEYGFVPLDAVVRAVQGRYTEVEEKDIRDLADAPDQHRFEIVEQGIRALYGHSFFVEMDGEPMEPPEHLYMWCTTRAAQRFRDQGIMPVDRYYVHLSLSREVAEARSRQGDTSCIVEVLAHEAHAEGIKFYSRGEVVLTREIPPEFVGEISGFEPGAADEGDGNANPADMSYGRKMRRGTRRP